jgi:hypothetical protein
VIVGPGAADGGPLKGQLWVNMPRRRHWLMALSMGTPDDIESFCLLEPEGLGRREELLDHDCSDPLLVRTLVRDSPRC